MLKQAHSFSFTNYFPLVVCCIETWFYFFPHNCSTDCLKGKKPRSNSEIKALFQISWPMMA